MLKINNQALTKNLLALALLGYFTPLSLDVGVIIRLSDGLLLVLSLAILHSTKGKLVYSAHCKNLQLSLGCYFLYLGFNNLYFSGLGEDHPQVKKLKSGLSQIKKQLEQEVNNIKKSLALELIISQEALQSKQQRLEQLKKK